MRLDDFVPLLRCPACEDSVHRSAGTVVCAQGHRFDIAKQGYVNLLRRGQPDNADTAEMVAARLRFLSQGHYRPIVDELLRQLPVDPAAKWLEAGAGPGWYLTEVLQSRPGSHALACDISVAAARRAAKAHDRLAAVVFDTWQRWPVASGTLDAVLTIFAPRHPEEFARVLRPGGVLIVVAPTGRHLASLRERHGLLNIADDKPASVATPLQAGFSADDPVTVDAPLELTAHDVSDVIAMGPNAHHRPNVAAEPIATDLSVTVSRWCRTK